MDSFELVRFNLPQHSQNLKIILAQRLRQHLAKLQQSLLKQHLIKEETEYQLQKHLSDILQQMNPKIDQLQHYLNETFFDRMEVHTLEVEICNKRVQCQQLAESMENKKGSIARRIKSKAVKRQEINFKKRLNQSQIVPTLFLSHSPRSDQLTQDVRTHLKALRAINKQTKQSLNQSLKSSDEKKKKFNSPQPAPKKLLNPQS